MTAIPILGAPRAVAASPEQSVVPPRSDDARQPGGSPAPPDQKTESPSLKLPGLTINSEARSVDIEATICLDEGALELVACTKGTKEHESILTVAARPIHIHTALLLVGAKNGNPAMRKPLDEEFTRWVDLPPRGDLIDVFLEFKDSTGQLVERPISDFIVRRGDHSEEPGSPEAVARSRFPNTFIFAGSQISDAGTGQREYLADGSGHVISIGTFGDELLCLPDVHSHDNGALLWHIDPTHLPKLGTKVTLRLRLKNHPTPKPNP
jgi:hypothetical protein